MAQLATWDSHLGMTAVVAPEALKQKHSARALGTQAREREEMAVFAAAVDQPFRLIQSSAAQRSFATKNLAHIFLRCKPVEALSVTRTGHKKTWTM